MEPFAAPGKICEQKRYTKFKNETEPLYEYKMKSRGQLTTYQVFETPWLFCAGTDEGVLGLLEYTPIRRAQRRGIPPQGERADDMYQQPNEEQRRVAMTTSEGVLLLLPNLPQYTARRLSRILTPFPHYESVW